MKKLVFLLLLPLAFTACRKKPLPVNNPDNNNPTDTVKKPGDTTGPGTMRFNLQHKVGSEDLVLNRSTPYIAPLGDSFRVTTFDYYLSNIVLIDAAGNRFVEQESYHLMRSSFPSSLQFSLSKVPKGKYVAVELMIGVDSTRNVSGAQTGDLSPELGMFWTWKNGYIMGKMEGVLLPSNDVLQFHIAGFYGMYSGLRTITIPLGDGANIKTDKTTDISLKADLNSWFTAPNFPGFSTVTNITSVSPGSAKIADNYATMFTLTGVKNP
jgi:hypothetical protein